MIRRPRRTVPAVVVGLVFLAIATLVGVCCVQVIIGTDPLLPVTEMMRAASGLTLNGPVILTAGAVLVLVGIVLLIAAVWPGKPQVLPLTPTNDYTNAGVARHSLARDLTIHAHGADGITHTHAVVKSRTVHITAQTAIPDSSGLAERVQELVTDRLNDISLARPLRVRVSVRPDRSIK